MPTFWKETSSTDSIVFFTGLGVIIVVLVLVNVFKSRLPQGTGTGTGSLGGGPRRFSGIALHRLAASAGLNRDQTKMLEYVLRSDNVVDPGRSLASFTLLDRHFKRAYRTIERTANTEEELQERLSLLFSTRNTLESSQGTPGLASTRKIAENTPAVISIGRDSYPARVISAKGDDLVVENPKNALGSPIRLLRGGKITLSFFTKSSKGFSFESRILGASESGEGPVLHLVHSAQIKRLSQRRFRRRQAVVPANFFFVRVEESGWRKEKKLVVDKRRLSGNITDISIGGCSIKTNVSVPSGTRLKIEFMHGDNMNIVILGQVLRTNRSGISTVMHVKFLKVPRRSLNAINALVYEYDDT
ncbi:MAG: PilZ domain-containing protein [Treponema sp.]|jgi:c-di-GMP-binding flagellar brake protein YcgR|nr:PilZ domain-containing protein [Treponema sp.]